MLSPCVHTMSCSRMFKSNSFTHHQVSSAMPARWHPARQQQLLNSAGVASRQQAPSCSSSVFARGPNRGVAARAAATDIELEEYQADNFYEILGVGPLSSPKEIKRAYKTMVCCLPDSYCLLYLLQHVMLALASWLLHNQHCLLILHALIRQLPCMPPAPLQAASLGTAHGVLYIHIHPSVFASLDAHMQHTQMKANVLA